MAVIEVSCSRGKTAAVYNFTRQDLKTGIYFVKNGTGKRDEIITSTHFKGEGVMPKERNFAMFKIVAGMMFLYFSAVSADVVNGTVTDSTSSAAIANALVQQAGTGNVTLTDAQGNFTLTINSTAVRNPRSFELPKTVNFVRRNIIWQAEKSMSIRLYTVHGKLLDNYSAGAGACPSNCTTCP